MLRSTRGDLEGGVALARRNCELTERIGDVFSRSLAIANLSVTELAIGDFDSALASIEEAERLYRDAMGSGGEMETWRGGLRAEALLGVGRVEEAADVARWASDVARERGMLWSLPLALLAVARAEAAAGNADAARAALDEAPPPREGRREPQPRTIPKPTAGRCSPAPADCDPAMSETSFVTGGSGFIGGRLIERLVGEGPAGARAGPLRAGCRQGREPRRRGRAGDLDDRAFAGSRRRGAATPPSTSPPSSASRGRWRSSSAATSRAPATRSRAAKRPG